MSSVDKHYKKTIAAMCAAMCAATGTASAGVLDLQAQAQYDFVQVKMKGAPAVGRSRFSTNYTLALRKPFVPSAVLISDLSFNATGSGDYNSTQNSKGWTLNLYASRPRYMLNTRVSRSDYGSSTGLLATTTGHSTDYNAGLFIREPAYPVVSLQFQRNVSGTQYGSVSSGYTTTTWLASTTYDVAPLRFYIDRSRQNFGFTGSPGSHLTSQTSSVALNQSILPGLTLSGELTKTSTDVSYTKGFTSSDVGRRVIRLTAMPLRTVVADVDFTAQNNRQDIGYATGTNRDRSITWDVRSEVFPGLTLDMSDQKQHQSGDLYSGTGSSTSRNRSASMSARLNDDTTFSVTKNRVSYDAGFNSFDARQDSLQAALQTSLTRTTDLTLNLGKGKSTTGADDSFDSTFEGISLRDRTSTRLTMGATYRRTKVRSLVAAGSTLDQNGDGVDLDLLWQPYYRMGLNMRFSYQNNRGSSAYRTLAPSANLRWQLDASTSLIANYAVQRFRQYDPATALALGQNTRGLSVRMTRNLANGSSLDVAYDFQASNFTNTEWRRQLRLSFVTRR